MGMPHLPAYQSVSNHVNLSDREFILTTYTMNVHTSRTANCKWLTEIKHDNPAWINTKTAESLDIRHGDTIRIRSGIGEIITKAFLTEGIHPQTVAIAQGCGHWEWGTIARAVKGHSTDPDTNLVWWKKVGNGVHPNSIIPNTIVPISGGQAWNDTKVAIEKV